MQLISENTPQCCAEDFPLFMNLARPDVYQLNGFRILGKLADAPAAEIRRQADRIRRRQRLGGVASPKECMLPVRIPPDELGVRDAIERLHDPESRWLDELLWFWPAEADKSTPNGPFQALATGDISKAIEIWSQRVSDPADGDIAVHNLAVLHHALALDHETDETDHSPASAQAVHSEEHWQRAFEYWKQLLAIDDFWIRFDERRCALDDPRLTKRASRYIRTTLAHMLLTISAQLAVQKAGKGKDADCERLIKAMRSAGFDNSLLERAFRGAVDPIQKKLNSITQKLWEEARKDKKNANRLLAPFLLEAQPLLITLEILLGKDNAICCETYDEIAAAGMSCVVAFAQETSDWQESQKLLRMLDPVPRSNKIRARLQENQEAVENNLAEGLCWFCGAAAADEVHGLNIKMYGDVNRTRTNEGIRTTWRHGTIMVPRCAGCAEAHGSFERQIMRNWGLAGGVILGSVVGAIFVNAGAMLIGALIGGFVGVSAGSDAGVKREPKPGTKSLASKNKYPRIKELEENGWKFGDKPQDQ